MKMFMKTWLEVKWKEIMDCHSRQYQIILVNSVVQLNICIPIVLSIEISSLRISSSPVIKPLSYVILDGLCIILKKVWDLLFVEPLYIWPLS